MKVLFLDFDGVLNNGVFLHSVGWNHLDLFEKTPESQKLSLLNKFIDPKNMNSFKQCIDQVPDVKIVISSSLGSFYNIHHFRNILTSYKISNHVLDITPRAKGMNKMDEILAYLKNNTEIKKKLILDDDDVNFFNPSIHLLKVDNFVGFSEIDSKKLIAYFEQEEVSFKDMDRGIL